MSLEIEAMLGRISRHKGVSGVMVFNTDGIPIINYNVHDPNLVTLLSYLCVKMHKYGRDIVKDLANSTLETLRIHSMKHEYLLCFEEDTILLAIYNQPIEHEVQKVEENEAAN